MEELKDKVAEYYYEGIDPHQLRVEVQLALREEGKEFTNDEVWNAIQEYTGALNGQIGS